MALKPQQVNPDLKIILNKKKILKSNITKLKTDITIKELDASFIELCENKHKKLSAELIDIFENILTFSELGDDEIESYGEEQQTVQETLDDIWLVLHRKKAEIVQIINPNAKNVSEVNSTSNENVEKGIRLPIINLPTYSGIINEWLNYADIFKASVHRNTSLSDAQKLSYLKMSLTGDAARVIQSINISDANYSIAWQLLNERYSNKREQVFAHIRKFINMSTVNNDTPNGILTIVDHINECLRSLETLELKIDTLAEIFMCHIVLQKVDNSTKSWFEREYSTPDELPQLSKLISFLKLHSRTLQTYKAPGNAIKNTQKRTNMRATSLITGIKNSKCIKCQREDCKFLYRCPKFLQMSIPERNEFIKRNGRCFRCLQSHVLKRCTSSYKCNKCNSINHSQVLHYDKPRESGISRDLSTDVTESRSPQSAHAINNCISLNPDAPSFQDRNSSAHYNDNAIVMHSTRHPSPSGAVKQCLLSTAFIYIKNAFNDYVLVRTLLDSGSSQCFMTHSCADRLCLPKSKANLRVSCLDKREMCISQKVTTAISDKRSYERTVNFHLVKQICDAIPLNTLNVDIENFPSVPLADPRFFMSSTVDVLIGAQFYYEFLKEGQIRVPNCDIILRNSIWGYIATGMAEQEPCVDKALCAVITDERNLNEQLKQFWNIECGFLEYNGENKTQEEIICEQHFLSTYTRDAGGKYIVNIPLKEAPSCLGDSLEFATKQLNSLYKRLVKQPECLTLYQNFISEYLELGHMELIREEREPSVTYYLPHHGVYKVSSISTPMRAVFNGSAITTSGKSLNSIQYTGGSVQDDLCSIMLRFRTHNVVFTADIRRMYRAIWVDPNQRDLLRIVWKEGLNEPIKKYKLCTVSYGLTSSPHLATRSLKQLAIDEGGELPLAAAVTLRDFYIDDILTGARDIEGARLLKNELIALLQRGGMDLHKWATNCPEIFNDNTEMLKTYDFFSDTKTLGIQWNPQFDYFTFKLSIVTPDLITKRSVLSQISQIFDPLGLIGALLTRAKIFMQSLWVLQVGWDDSLPMKEELEWKQFLGSLSDIEHIKVPRYLHLDNANVSEIHGFCDASSRAYGACIYIKCIDIYGNVFSNLLCSKSRVSPTKTITIPRLELCAALLLAQLYKRVVQALQLSEISVFFWCDSRIVLAWLHKEPCQLKIFVGNRISKIQNLTNISDWHHVPTELNSADILSRGSDCKSLINNDLWFHGPNFIQQSNFPQQISEPLTSEFYVELKDGESNSSTENNFVVSLVTEKTTFINYLISRSNNFTKLLYICAYIFRFVDRLKNPQNYISGPITSTELNSSRDYLVKGVQRECFQDDISRLQSGKSVLNNSKLKELDVFLDENEVLRVGGRLHNTNLSHARKHPIVLPHHHKLTEIIVSCLHIQYLHIGPQGLLYNVRNTYWPLNGRNLCRKIVHKCISCFKNNPVVSQQIMGRLPRERVTPDFVFNCTGLDFCGPFFIKYRGQRKGVLHKVYICVFVCMVTKALHLELVDNLTSEAFIASLKRFFSRRGKSRKLYSDNATNLTGAHSEIKRLFMMVNKPDKGICNYLTNEGIEWGFIPPRGAHHGGVWEAGVKSIKFHLKRVVSNEKLTYEQFLTVITQIEGMLNSRPLTPLSSSIEDLDILTPGHFLIGRPINTLAEPLLHDLNIHRLNIWQRITSLVQRVWKLWSNSYLSNLQQRQKWRFVKDNVKIGDMVILKEENLPPNKWMMGRIIEVIPGKDKQIRVVSVKTQGGVLKRPISRLCVLPLEDQPK